MRKLKVFKNLMNIEFISHVDRVFLNIYFHSSFVLKISVALVKSIL